MKNRILKSTAAMLFLALSGSMAGTPVAAMERAQGTVKWFNAVKGYGFIYRDGGYPDVFVRSNATIIGDCQLVAGQVVQFEIVDGSKGPEANWVSCL